VWGGKPPVLVIPGVSGPVSLALVLTKGVAASIRIDDPGQWLSQNEGKTPGAHLLVGLVGDNAVFQSASVASQDAAGRNYQVLIPFDTPLKLVVSSFFFRLSDAAGVPLNSSTTIPVAVAKGQSGQNVARISVTGGGR
jgi:hypothetical protein